MKTTILKEIHNFIFSKSKSEIMFPFFPSLRPPIANHSWFEVDAPVNEEAEILQYERNQHNWIFSFSTTAADIHPIGKVQTAPGPETDDEDANDESDDSDSHDDDDDDTNDRVITGPAQGFYSPADDVSMNEEGTPAQNT